MAVIAVTGTDQSKKLPAEQLILRRASVAAFSKMEPKISSINAFIIKYNWLIHQS